MKLHPLPFLFSAPSRVIAVAFLGTAASEAQSVQWNKLLDYDLNDSKTVSLVGALSGVSVGPIVSNITIGYEGLALNGRTKGSDITPDHYSAYLEADDFFSITLAFDHLLDGGSFLRVGSLQWVSDWTISISGGNGTLTNVGVQPLVAGKNEISPDGTISGNGTDTLSFHTTSPLGVSFDDYYNGGTGIAITGTWSTVTLRAFNPNPSGFGESFDSIAGLTVYNATVVSPIPEPSALLMAGVAAGTGLFVRRRKAI